MNGELLFSKIGISEKIGQDIFLLLLILLVSFLFSLLIGRHRILAVLINTYVSFALLSVAPEKLFSSDLNKFFVFLVILIVLTLANRRFFDVYFPGSSSSIFWKMALLGFLEITLILSIALSFLPKKEALNYVSLSAYDYLVLDWSQLFWMIAPLAFVFFFGRKRLG